MFSILKCTQLESVEQKQTVDVFPKALSTSPPVTSPSRHLYTAECLHALFTVMIDKGKPQQDYLAITKRIGSQQCNINNDCCTRVPDIGRVYKAILSTSNVCCTVVWYTVTTLKKFVEEWVEISNWTPNTVHMSSLHHIINQAFLIFLACVDKHWKASVRG